MTSSRLAFRLVCPESCEFGPRGMLVGFIIFLAAVAVTAPRRSDGRLLRREPPLPCSRLGDPSTRMWLDQEPVDSRDPEGCGGGIHASMFCPEIVTRSGYVVEGSLRPTRNLSDF